MDRYFEDSTYPAELSLLNERDKIAIAYDKMVIDSIDSVVAFYGRMLSRETIRRRIYVEEETLELKNITEADRISWGIVQYDGGEYYNTASEDFFTISLAFSQKNSPEGFVCFHPLTHKTIRTSISEGELKQAIRELWPVGKNPREECIFICPKCRESSLKLKCGIAIEYNLAESLHNYVNGKYRPFASTLDVVECSQCSFQAKAKYDLQDNYWSYLGWEIPSTELKRLEHDILSCPNPNNHLCTCQLHVKTTKEFSDISVWYPNWIRSQGHFGLWHGYR